MPQPPNIYGSPFLPIFEASSDGVGVVGLRPWQFLYANSKLATWLGLSPQVLREREVEAVFSDAGLLGIGVELERAQSGSDSVTSAVRRYRVAGWIGEAC